MQPVLRDNELKTVCSAKSFYIFHHVPHITWKRMVAIRERHPPLEVSAAAISPSTLEQNKQTKYLCYLTPEE